MIAPKYIDTSIINQLLINQSFSVHCKKLKTIKTQGSGRYDCKSTERIQLPHLTNRWKSANNSNYHLVKAAQISKQNKVILNKILDISTQRTLTSRHSNIKKWKTSLNVEGRIKEAKRIEKDNKQLALRISNRKPDIIVEDLEKQYKIFEKFKNRLSRAKVLDSRRAKSSNKNLLNVGDRDNKVCNKAYSPVERFKEDINETE